MDTGWQHNYEIGKKLFEEKQYEAALAYLEKVADEKRNFADVYNMLGLLYYYKGFLNRAVSSFKRALEINPNYTEASLNLSVAYNELGEFDKAREAYMMAREARKEENVYFDPYVKGKLSNMHAAIAAVYRGLGICAQAADEYRKALVLSPEFVDIKTNLGATYREMKDYPNAVRELTEAVRINEAYIPARIQLGLTFYAMGLLEKARAEWGRVLEKNPEDKLARMYMSLLSAHSR